MSTPTSEPSPVPQPPPPSSTVEAMAELTSPNSSIITQVISMNESSDGKIVNPETGEITTIKLIHGSPPGVDVQQQQQQLPDKSTPPLQLPLPLLQSPPVSPSKKPITNLAAIQNENRVQDVRVDNWGNYVIQRFQNMYDKGDFCDLTLKFLTGETLKVHRVVVNLCTEYFATIERLFGLKNGVLFLPKDVDYQSIVTIVKFFYTGKLEVRGSQFNDIYRTVKVMNITILIKLLEAHAKKPPPSVVKAKKEQARPIVFKQSPVLKGQQNQQQNSLIAATKNYSGPKGSIVNRSNLPPGAKTKTVLARVQAKSSMIQQGNNPSKTTIIQKKLPIWKDRKFTTQVSPNSDPHHQNQNSNKIIDEPAGPTRFEWHDPLDSESHSTSTHTLVIEKQQQHHQRQNLKPTSNFQRKSEDIFDAVKSQQAAKRSITMSNNISTNTNEPLSKMPKIDSSITTSNNLNLTEENVEKVSTNQQNESSGGITVETSISIEIQDEGSLDSSTPSSSPTKTTSILHKDQSKNKLNQKPEKTVRFADQVSVSTILSKTSTTTSTATNKPHPITISSSNGADPLSNHSKIISEVLKKYPDLVKENRNIKLKIVQKSTDQSSSSSSKDTKTKVSYIVLKSTSKPDEAGTLVPKKAPTNATTGFWDTDKSPKRTSTAAKNVDGPWLCNNAPCGTEESPLPFESYLTYRRHLVSVHSERIDSRICEYCGVTLSKRNLLLYHQYTKHSIPPPKNCVFPHCIQCDYVALSESLLSKHMQSHGQNKEYACTVCNASFKSNGALQGHMAANLHRNKDNKAHECPYCKKNFVRQINLKAHIRSIHKDIAKIEELVDENTSKQQGLISTQQQQIDHEDQIQPIHQQAVSLIRNADGTLEVVHGIDQQHLNVSNVNVPVSIDGVSLGFEGVPTTLLNNDGTHQAVYIMDAPHNQSSAVEINMPMGLAADGSLVHLESNIIDGSGEYIVQDIHGNQVIRKLTTGIDETGKQVIFFQMTDEHGNITMTPATILDEAMASQQIGITRFEGEGQQIGTTTTGQNYEFVSVSSDEHGQQQYTVEQNDHSMYLDPQTQKCFVSSEGIPISSGDLVTVDQQPIIITTNADGERIDLVRMETDQQSHHDQEVLSEHHHVSETEVEIQVQDQGDDQGEEVELNSSIHQQQPIPVSMDDNDNNENEVLENEDVHAETEHFEQPAETETEIHKGIGESGELEISENQEKAVEGIENIVEEKVTEIEGGCQTETESITMSNVEETETSHSQQLQEQNEEIIEDMEVESESEGNNENIIAPSELPEEDSLTTETKTEEELETQTPVISHNENDPDPKTDLPIEPEGSDSDSDKQENNENE